MTHLVYHFYIAVSPQVDPWSGHDVQIDICTVDCITLEEIHSEVIKTLQIDKSSKLYYKKREKEREKERENENDILDLNMTLKELGIDANSTIILDRLPSKRSRTDEILTSNSTPTMTLFLITRFGSKDGITPRRLKVICKEDDDFGEIMEELSDTLERNGLKFKFGRSILKAGKTISEQGLSDGCEVMVVGGRG